MQGDNDRASEIEEDVREWNKTAKGTAMEIGDFRNRSQRALKEAKRPTKERLLRTLPKESRADIERTFDILAY
jgi:molecular chaperone GrpE (heat shock protein)